MSKLVCHKSSKDVITLAIKAFNVPSAISVHKNCGDSSKGDEILSKKSRYNDAEQVAVVKL